MVESRPAARRTPRSRLLIGLLLATTISQPASAHHRAHRGRIMLARAAGLAASHGGRAFAVHNRPGGYTPPFAAYAVDGNSGRVLYAQDENALRHPASITKVMTLYLLFERLERGQLSLDDRLEVSEHAAAQSPTKLGLRPGATIRIEDAIKSIVTKSANDMAVAVAERIGGDEHTFAQMMTRKAHALGMSRTNFVNASGLPEDMQLTTAHDLAILGRAIHDRYPRYFRFFSTPSFRYAGQFMPNHNHLMEQVEGMDGIKTGYTRSSGFNLLSSVNRDGHWLVSVVLGGRTRLGRDRIMADLIASQIDKCATQRTAPVIAENPLLEHVAEAIPVIEHEGEAAPPVEGVDEEAAERAPGPTRAAAAHASLQGEAARVAGDEEGAPAVEEARGELQAPGDAQADEVRDSEPRSAGRARPAPPRPEAAKPDIVRQQAARAVTRVGEAVLPRPRPAFVSASPRDGDHDMTATGSIRPNRRSASRPDGATTHYAGQSTATPSTLRHASFPEESPQARGGWMIQVGATPSLAEANALLARVRGQNRGLATAHPLTEKVQKGHATLYRARFAGLEGDRADAMCRALKKSGISCIAMKN